MQHSIAQHSTAHRSAAEQNTARRQHTTRPAATRRKSRQTWPDLVHARHVASLCHHRCNRTHAWVDNPLETTRPPLTPKGGLRDCQLVLVHTPVVSDGVVRVRCFRDLPSVRTAVFVVDRPHGSSGMVRCRVVSSSSVPACVRACVRAEGGGAILNGRHTSSDHIAHSTRCLEETVQ